MPLEKRYWLDRNRCFGGFGLCYCNLGNIHERSGKPKGLWSGNCVGNPREADSGESLCLGFLATNNEAEYEVILARMEMVNKFGGEVIEIYSDSRLVVGQVNGEFEARAQRMQGYLIKVKRAQTCFKSFALKQITREQNSQADLLAMLATSLGLGLPQVIIIEDMITPSHDDQLLVEVYSIQVGPS